MKHSYTDLEANNVVIVQAKDFNENILKANNNAGALLLKIRKVIISQPMFKAKILWKQEL